MYVRGLAADLPEANYAPVAFLAFAALGIYYFMWHSRAGRRRR